SEWDIFADSNETAARIKECRAGKIKPVTASMARPSQELFERGNVASLFVSGEKMRAHVRNDLSALKGSISTTLREVFTSFADAGIVGVGAPGPKRIPNPRLLVAGEVLSQAASHLIDETDTLTTALSADKDGIELHALVAIAPNSPTDQFVARHPSSE